MKQPNQLDRIEMMLEALLSANKQTEWIGSYAHARTSSGDPYIVLFPSSDKLKQKFCRVYSYKFEALRGLVPLDVADNVPRSAETPKKTQARPVDRRFKALVSMGKDTSMGNEKRFENVLQVSQYETRPAQGSAEPKRGPAGPTPETTQRRAETSAQATRAVAAALINDGITDQQPEDVCRAIAALCGRLTDSRADKRGAYAAGRAYYKGIAGGVDEPTARRAAQAAKVEAAKVAALRA